MSQLQQKSWRFKVLVIGISGYVAGVLMWDILGAGKAQRQMDQAREKVEILQTEQAKLQRQLAVVTSEEFAEEQIRDELLLAKPGETVVVVPRVAPFDSLDFTRDKFAQGKQEKQENLANWQKWTQLFIY